ncbi:cell division protein ZapE [Candidatus Woesearchaeota archaeon]|nr:cell division protein ZapE [Candidatus Woesearchaeota archaeon]
MINKIDLFDNKLGFLNEAANKVWHEIRGVRAQYCWIPTKYENVSFKLSNPSPAQETAANLLMALLQGQLCTDNNLLLPEQGIYLHGHVGTGKTHLLAAYANGIHKQLLIEEKKRKTFVELKLTEILNCLYEDFKSGVKTIDGHLAYEQTVLDGPHKQGETYNYGSRDERLNYLKGTLDKKFKSQYPSIITTAREKFRFTESYMVFLGFEELLRIKTGNQTIMDELVVAPILFLDDLHPKDDDERAKVIQEVLERRYENDGRATFVTSNLSPEELVKVGNYSDKIANRIVSRCKEMFYVIDTSDAEDYRQIIGNDRKKNIDLLLQKAKKTRK